LAGQARAGDERPAGSGGRLPQEAATRRRDGMTPTEHGSSVIEFPSELEILITREFEAPIALVFDVFTKEEHVRKTIAPFGEVVTECSIDLRVGGDYQFIFVGRRGGVRVPGHVSRGRAADAVGADVAVRGLAGHRGCRVDGPARIRRSDDPDLAARVPRPGGPR